MADLQIIRFNIRLPFVLCGYFVFLATKNKRMKRTWFGKHKNL